MHNDRAAPSADWAEVLLSLGMAIISRDPDGTYSVRSPVPEWFLQVLPDHAMDTDNVRLDFLGNFKSDAEEFWSGQERGPLQSGEWTEITQDGREHRFEAMALRLASGRNVLVVRNLNDDYGEQQNILQAARETSLR
ncbi:MAG: hypothetical protein ACPG77_13130, partial [Nannocystaceae bacterium]